jgi:hypothetical protein
MTETDPIIVHSSPAREQASTAARDVTLIVAALPALIAVLGTRDVKAIVDYVASAEFAPVLGLIVSLAVMAWRQRHTRRAKARMVKLAEASPDALAIVARSPAARSSTKEE